MNIWIISFAYIVTCSGFFIRCPFGKKFSIKDNEMQKQIEYTLPAEKQMIINKIHGIYALIGPDINIKKVSTLFDLFIGDGIIQSVIFDNGNLTFVKHYVRTEKLLYEEENGRLPKSVLAYSFFGLLNFMNVFPNPLGVSNTALLNIKHNLYALYERDSPYSIDINFKNKTITTGNKINIPKMNFFSAHSKYDKTIDSIEYNMMKNCIQYRELTEDFCNIKGKEIKMKYLPLVHDFVKFKNQIVITDSPLVIDFQNLFKKSMPVVLDKNKNTFIYILDKTRLTIEKYVIQHGFYIFHYADYKEDDLKIEIYASLYDNLDFSELNIRGKYRKIIINKETKTVIIVKNPELEKLDLEFPVKFNDRIVFRSMENKRINGFVVCKELEVIKKIDFGNVFISGEPAIHYIEHVPYLIAFGFNDNNAIESYLIVVNMNTYEIINIPIHESLNVGFHSIFLEN